MNAGHMIAWLGSVVLTTAVCRGAEALPTGPTPPALQFRHFPDRLHVFVWRNWEMTSLEPMAEVPNTTAQSVLEIGQSMGLPTHVTPPAEYRQHGYISTILRNWHILPCGQLLTLLGWDAERLAFTLREDDFLWIKLGSLKPACPLLRYTTPDEATVKQCAEIKAVVASHFGDEFDRPVRPRFDFFSDMPDEPGSPRPSGENGDKPIRFLCSYSGVFGDPLLHSELAPIPTSCWADGTCLNWF